MSENSARVGVNVNPCAPMRSGFSTFSGCYCTTYVPGKVNRMARPDKTAAVAELTEDFRTATATVLTEYRGLTVTSMKKLRRALGAETKFGRDAVDGHRTRPDGSDLKWKQIGVKEITDSRELPFFIQWLTEEEFKNKGPERMLRSFFIA